MTRLGEDTCGILKEIYKTLNMAIIMQKFLLPSLWRSQFGRYGHQSTQCIFQRWRRRLQHW